MCIPFRVVRSISRRRPTSSPIEPVTWARIHRRAAAGLSVEARAPALFFEVGDHVAITRACGQAKQPADNARNRRHGY